MPTFVHALSADRFDTYLKWAGADQTLAERLYTYNVQLSAALYGPLHMLEVVLRNMADARLAAQHGAAWIDDPAILVTNYQTGAIAKARQTLQKDGKAATRPQIVAELNFGFWASLFGPKSHHLWQSLRPIFQAKGVQRGVIARDLRDLRILRNRVAHYEPIIALPLAQR